MTELRERIESDIRTIKTMGKGSSSFGRFGRPPRGSKRSLSPQPNTLSFNGSTKGNPQKRAWEEPAPGFAYPLDNMRPMRGFDSEKCWHQGVDIGGVNDMGGVGEKVYAIVKAKIYFIGTPESDPRKFGHRVVGVGKPQLRGGYLVPTQLEVDGYGTVYPFTRNLGTAKTGVFIVTKAIHPKLDGYKVRYMHLAAVRPDLQRGDIVEAGEEIGVLGSTAIMHSAPHVHIDIENKRSVRVDVSQYIGLGKVYPSKCRGGKKKAWARQRRARRARKSTKHRR
ncbi:MAG: peptidoglycan DD-metalloendopeptidase family protein [Myxococcota bacterium]|nr:peptidoglycan DD-metalloendopeptidase family protein [Myxococcota bacterium]